MPQKLEILFDSLVSFVDGGNAVNIIQQYFNTAFRTVLHEILTEARQMPFENNILASVSIGFPFWLFH